MHLAAKFLMVVLLSILTCTAVWCQGTAQIQGSVTDQSQAVIAKAQVTVTQTNTGITRTTATNEAGFFALPDLPIGPYKLEVVSSGFTTYSQTGILLQVNDNPVIKVVLRVGQTTQTVDVTASAELVQTRDVGVGTVMENERIVNLPLNGRQVTDLIKLSGAAVNESGSTNSGPSAISLPVGSFSVGSSLSQSVPITIGGSFNTSNAYVLDGAFHNDPWDNLNLPLPFPDALQEFQVQTSGLSAQYGVHSGATISAVTKSGTNGFHGDAFEFLRNDLFNARNAFATSKSTLKRNQFGGVFGGPIKRDKLFFFGGYQGTTLRQDAKTSQSFVPTAAMLSGDWTAFTSPACNGGKQITLGKPFVNNKINPLLYDKVALALVAKLPTTSNPCGLISYGTINHENAQQAVGRVDYQLNSKHSIFGRYLYTADQVEIPYNLSGGNLLTVGVPGYDDLAQSVAFGDTYLINMQTVSSFHLALNRSSVHRLVANVFNPEDIGINVYHGAQENGFPIFAVSGGFTLGTTSNRAHFIGDGLEASEDVNIIRGTHQISFGAELGRWATVATDDARCTPNFTFNGSGTGLGMADLFNGNLSLIDQSICQDVDTGEWFLGVYAQDQWKVSPRLTLNYGLRWEPYFPQSIAEKRVYDFSLSRFYQGLHSTVFPLAPAGFTFPGDPGSPGDSGRYRDWLDVGPRVGLAWDPQGNGRTSIRASYALAYDFQSGQYTLGTAGNAPPYGSRIEYVPPFGANGANGALDNPWASFPGGNPFPFPPITSSTPFVQQAIFNAIPPNLPTMYIQSWNLSIQRQVATDWLLSASYLGSHGVHMTIIEPLNSAVFMGLGPCTIQGVSYPVCSTTANTQARRILTLARPQDGQYISFLDENTDAGLLSYNGILLSVQRRPVKGVTLSANYTWSHCLDDPAQLEASNAGANSYQNPNRPHGDWGNCDADRRHNFNSTAVAESPRFDNSVLRSLATGWRLSGIFSLVSGTPLNVTTGGVDRALSGTQNQRGEQVSTSNVYGSSEPLSYYVNPADFAQPALGTLGNVGRNSLIGPKFWSFDLGLEREFAFRENLSLEPRIEIFNVTNSFRPLNPIMTLSTPNTFGQIRTAADPRILQFSLKLLF